MEELILIDDFKNALIKSSKSSKSPISGFYKLVEVVFNEYYDDILKYLSCQKYMSGRIDSGYLCYGDIGKVIFDKYKEHFFIPASFEGTKLHGNYLSQNLWERANRFLLRFCLYYMLRDGIIDTSKGLALAKEYKVQELEYTLPNKSLKGVVLNILYFILSILYGGVLILGLGIILYYAINWIMGLNGWLDIIIFVLVAGFAIKNTGEMLGMILSLPLMLLRKKCRFSIFIPILLLLIFGIGIIVYPWLLDIEYTWDKILSGIVIDIIISYLFYGIGYGIFLEE